MSESTRVQSQAKADSDLDDVISMLEWLVERGERIEFKGVEEDRRESHMEVFRKLRSRHSRADELLEIVLD